MIKKLQNDLPPTADIVIIGGGPAATAALWAIHRAEPQARMILLEKNEFLGSGSSVASLECFRSCWGLPCNARQMERSIEVFFNPDEFFGESAAEALAVKQHGYLFCGFSSQQAQALKADVEHLHKIGLTHVEYLDASEVHYRFPYLEEKVVAAKFDPKAGSLDSNGLIQSYVRTVPSAQIVTGSNDLKISVAGGRVTGVETSKGNISAPRVVIACGAEAREVGQTAGIELPIVVRPRQSFTTSFRHENFSENAPLVIGARPYPHVRPVGQTGAIFGWEYHWHSKVADSGHENILKDALRQPVYPVSKLKDARFPSITLTLLARQFGHKAKEGFNDPRYLRGLQHNAGYYVYRDASAAYTITSDGMRQPYHSERAIIDQHPEVAGLFLSIAHVGHGIMTSPAAGEILASKILGQSLPDPLYADFSINVPYVLHDENAL